MKIHEYQALALLSAFGVPCVGGTAVQVADEAAQAARALGGNAWVVKAQIHAGGRGKAGGIIRADSPEQVQAAAEKLLGSTLVTPQTGPEGRVVRHVLVAPAIDIASEYYLGMLVDGRDALLMASDAGGTEIEEVAAAQPYRIASVRIEPGAALSDEQVAALATPLGLTAAQADLFAQAAHGLVTLFFEKDCTLAEINPLALTADGQLLAADAKVNFDDNALFRHKDIAALRDEGEEDPREVAASKLNLSYIGLTGDIGCMVNGAGLAMATMDMISAYGGHPANFLDVGGGASAERVAGAFRILLGDARVKGILVNIFGGIMRCDVLAEGIVEAAKAVDLRLPLVVRLRGTNAQQGSEILAQSGLKITAENDMAQAVRAIVDAVQAAH